ncbi:WXG100 family type VII secretion target [Streptomyces sp. NPDC003016]
MSGSESATEELVELGIELVNPGGRPEELRQAAKAWRRLQSDLAGLDGLLKALDKRVDAVVGTTWRGPAAEAFKRHWGEVKAEVGKATEQYDEVARQLDEAADSIEQINSEIHDIYIEIGVSIGVGVALSFVTLGLGSAAAATNVARLAGQAIRLSEQLGRLLHSIAAAMRSFQRSGKLAKLLMDFGINWAGNTFGATVGAGASADGVDGAGLYEATWQGGVASFVGTPLGMAGAGGARYLMRNRRTAGFGMLAAENMAGGVVGNVSGGLAVDKISQDRGEKPEWLKNVTVNAAGGALGGVGLGAVGHHRQQGGVDGSFTPPADFDATRLPGGGRRGNGPHFAIDVPLGGVGAAAAGVGGEVVAPDGSTDKNSPQKKAEANPQASPRQRDIRDDFG